MPSQKQIREEITKRIIEALEKGVKPWRRPWSISPNSGRPTNIVSRKLYTGINPLLLELHSLRFGFRSKWWGTFHQWSDLGCTVKKRPDDVEPGHWGCSIVLWKPFTKIVAKDTARRKKPEFFMMRYFTRLQCGSGRGKSRREVPSQGRAGHRQRASRLSARRGTDRRDRCRHSFRRRPGISTRRPVPEGSWPEPPGRRLHLPTAEASVQSARCILRNGHPRTCPLERGPNGLAASPGRLCDGRIGRRDRRRRSFRPNWASPRARPWRTTRPTLAVVAEGNEGRPGYIFKASTQASKVADYLLAFVRKEEAVAAG